MTTWTRPAPPAHPPPESLASVDTAADSHDDSDDGSVISAKQQKDVRAALVQATDANLSGSGAAKWGLLGSTVDQVTLPCTPNMAGAHVKLIILL